MIMLNEKEREVLENILEKALEVHKTGKIRTETTAGIFRGLCRLFEESSPPSYVPEDDLWGVIERILDTHKSRAIELE